MPSIEQLQRLLASDPRDPFVLYGLAQALAKDSRHEEAIPHYDDCLAADPAYLYAYYHKARSLEALGRIDEARATLTRGLSAAREAGDAHAAREIGTYLDML